ncbi:MAG: polymer-forming cytoskeletal protein [Terriglobia bacterium]
MWWEKKPVTAVRQAPAPVLVPLEKPVEEKPMAETMKASAPIPVDSGRTQLGRSLVVKGELSGNEDLIISGQFEGTINVQGHCLTIGPEGKVKAEIQAARVVIYGSVHGNISVRERVEIYKTGTVVGDLVAPGISIEDGAYFKGKIEILREGSDEEERPLPTQTFNPSAPLASRAVSG